MPGLQQSSSNTGSTDSGFTKIEKILNEVSEPFKNYPINAVHAPKNPKMKQNFTRFCTYCKNSGHILNLFWSLKTKKTQRGKTTIPTKKTYSESHPGQSKSPKNYRSKSNEMSNTQRGRSESPYVPNSDRSRSNSYFGTVRSESRRDKLKSLYDTLQSSNPIHQSSLQNMEIRN